MKKKLTTLLMLLLCVCSGAWASTETVSWTGMATSSANADKAGAATSAQLTPASGVIASGISAASGTKTISDVAYYRYTGFPASEDTGYYFEYSFTVASGYAFTPSKLSIGWAPNGSKSVCFNVYVGTSSSDLVKIGNLVHGSDNTYDVDDITDFSALGLKTDFTLVRLVPCGNNKNVILNSVSIQGSLVSDSKTAVTLSFASASGSMDIASVSPSLPAVTSDPDVTAITEHLKYSTSNSAVATVNASTGALTLEGIGTTTITVVFEGDSNYKPASDTYTLTVTDATKLGYAEVLNPDDKTLANRWLFGMSHASVTQTFANYYSDGAIVDDGANVSTLYLNGEATANQYTNTKSWRKTQNGFIVEGKEQWVGYNIEIDEDYLLNLTHLDARILIADNTYTWYVEILDKNGIQVYKSANQTTTKASTANLSTDINLTNLSGTVSVKLWVTQGGTHKRFSIEKLILTGTTAEDTRDSFTITYNKGTGTGIVPDNASVREGDGYKTIKSYFLTKSGETFIGWKNAETTYTVGQVFVPEGPVTLTAQFEPNAASLSASAAPTTVLWDFQRKNIGSFNLASGTFVAQATIEENTIDVPLTFDKQVRNNSWEDWATFNSGVTMTIPAIKGMQITMLTYSSPSTTTIAGATDYTVTGSNAPYTVSYTYNGTDETIDICPSDASYIRTLTVLYPKTLATKPTITKGDFVFSAKGYALTVTAEDGDALYVSTDGSSYTVQTSPYETTLAAGTTCYAKTSVDGGTTYSNVVTCTNELDGAKSYVAWVYESNYANAPNNYNVANDEIYKALAATYNVILVDIKDYKTAMTDEQKAALNGNLDDADLVVISEAAVGSSKGLLALKDIVGTVPMLNMKLYAYSTGRWAWGTPKNVGTATADVTITPASKFYKVLNGVTFDGDNVALFSYPNTQNHIQYVDSWTAEPANDVVLANVTIDETAKPAMHASNSLKYFALGLSCDDFTKYNANAIAIVKNAAAMLIAGENLDAEMATVTATVGANGYTTFACSYPLDLTNANRPDGLKAYKATLDGTTVTFTPINQTVPAGTGLLLLGETKGGSYDITVAASGDAISTAFTGVVAPTSMQSVADNTYYFFMKKAASAESPLEFAPLSTSAVTIPAGKAYITVANSAFESPARELSFTFDDGETTGLADVRGKMADVRGDYYNLNGQLVAQPTKGLYIVNGRKVVIR